MIVEKRIKFGANHHEIETELNNGERLVYQGEAEVSSSTTKPAGDGNQIAIYTLKPLLVEIKGSDTEYETPKQAGMPQTRSKSKRLRDVLYVLWQQQYTSKYKSFDDYYEQAMDVLIDRVKEKLQ